jgi:hypothetical protein
VKFEGRNPKAGHFWQIERKIRSPPPYRWVTVPSNESDRPMNTSENHRVASDERLVEAA